ncbi:MAG: porin [Sterolibacterium sp.]|nr:porin [Sterolibacterium sp.]MBP9798696.1 porin [Sterolibacterium sp.]
MQKKLIALAVAGLVSTGAFANSTAVTVYGVADLSFDFVKTSGGVAGSQTGTYTRVSSNSSYIGFKGTEDVGNGMKALFQFENGVGADTGAMFNSARDTYAGLAGAYGDIKLGTLTTPTRALGGAVDVNAGWAGIGSSAALTNTSGFDTRQTNTAQFTSANFSGFSGALAYISGENKTASGNPAKADGRAWDLGLNYNNGPILAGLTYANGKARDGVDSQTKNTRVAGAYDFGMGSVRALWNQVKFENNVGLNSKQTTWGLGGTFNAAPNGKVIAQYYKLGNVNGTSNTGAKLFELGYEHSLSKRTVLKAIYARINNDNASAANFATNPVNNVLAGNDPSGFQVGIRHAF